MQNPKIISLLVVPLFYLGLTCFLPKKATAEMIQTGIQTISGELPISCDTDTQQCYTPTDGELVYIGTLDEVQLHQEMAANNDMASICGSALGGNQFSALILAKDNIDCTSYGYSQEENMRIYQTGNSGNEALEKILKMLYDMEVLDMEEILDMKWMNGN